MSFFIFKGSVGGDEWEGKHYGASIRGGLSGGGLV